MDTIEALFSQPPTSRVNPKSVNLVLPGLFKSLQSTEVNSAEHCHSPLFQQILSKSSYHHVYNAEPKILATDYVTKLPLAFYESGEVEQTGVTFLYAEPVCIDVKSDHIVAYPISINNHHDKIVNLISKLNEYFSVDGLSFEYLSSGRIICKSINNLVPEMTPSYSIYGRDVKHFLPEGEGDKFWLRLFNEVQMFLHEYIKEEDRRFGTQLLNGFWFWGANNEKDVPLSDDAFIGEVDWLKGFTSHHRLEYCQLTDIKSSRSQYFNVVDESLLLASSVGDFDLWLKSLNKIENEILQPLNNLLASGVINKITIQGPEQTTYEYKAIHRFRFFRKQIPLQKICVVDL